MKYLPLFSISVFVLLFPGILPAAEVAPVPRDSNFGNTAGYDSTRVEAQLLVPVKEQTRVLHFIRDNNDPRVVTKAYLLKHVDVYEFRDYLRQMVQAKRVGNTALQQQYPLNAVNGGTGTPGSGVGIGTAQASTVASTVSHSRFSRLRRRLSRAIPRISSLEATLRWSASNMWTVPVC